MEFIIPTQSGDGFFQPVGYRNNTNTQHSIVLDLTMTGDSSGNVDSTDKKTFSMQLQEKLVIDRLSDVYLSSITTQNTKLNTSSDTANFILKINELTVHTATNQAGLVSEILITNNTKTDGTRSHKSNKLNYVCTVNPSTIRDLSGSITMNDKSTLLLDNTYVERVTSRYIPATGSTPATGIVLHGVSGGGNPFGGSPWFIHARQYDQNVVEGTSGKTPKHAELTNDLAYYTVSGSLTVLKSLGGKDIDEIDEDGVRAVVVGDIVYTKQHLGDGPLKQNELASASDPRSLVNDYNNDGTVDYDHTISSWVGSGPEAYHVAGSEFRSVGKVMTITDDGTTLWAGTTGRRLTFTGNSGHAGHHDKYGQDRGNISLSVGGSSLWIENTSKATTFRCIIELVIIPRKDK